MYHREMQIRHGSSGPKKQGLGHEAASILIFGFAVFCLFALLTYQPTDPSFFGTGGQEEVIQNACGRIGAMIASVLVEFFGIAAFLTPAAIAFVGSVVHKREGGVRLVGTLGGMTVAVASLTVFLGLQWKYWPMEGTLILTGGALGAWLAEVLVAQFNPFGSSLVSLLVFLLAIALSTPVSVAHAGAWLLKKVGGFSWKLTRLVGTYAAYLIGLLAMRTAHAAGDFLQNQIEAAFRRVKERSRARAQAVAASKVPALAADPEIGLPELAAADEDAAQDDEDAFSEDDEPSSSVVSPRVARAAGQAVAASGASEAPNALPELEKKGAQAPTQNPEIVPLDSRVTKNGQIELNVETAAERSAKLKAAEQAAKRAEEKLSRLARSKRGSWKLPSLDFLRKTPKVDSQVDKEKLLKNSQILSQKLLDFGIEGEVTAVRPGPVITLYEFKPGTGVKVARVASMADDLSMALSAQSVRILAPLPGKSVVGIEIPSEKRETVYLREFLQHPDFHGDKHQIPVVMGKDIAGQPYLSDLARMPHLLCAGQTGSGKSVFMNGLICSLLYRFTPDELRMIMVDPKVIEFRAYQDIPHLLLPVVADSKHAATALKWAVREMGRRYQILAKMGARNLAGFNQKVDEMGVDVVRDLLLGEENQGDPSMEGHSDGNDWLEVFESDETGAPRIGKLPYIVIVIDEQADLMMIAKKEVEVSIARIAQKARAAGIHLIIATQRPSTDVVTGLIKANLPSRVSFQLASFVDSKTILDRQGAERLLGQGDMLFIAPGTSNLMRLHGAYLSDEEIEKITSFLRSQGKPAYREEILVDEDAESEGGFDGEEADDPMFPEALELAKRAGHVSASFLQRHLKVGYNRAARMVETMESRGIVGPADGSRPREVLIR